MGSAGTTVTINTLTIADRTNGNSTTTGTFTQSGGNLAVGTGTEDLVIGRNGSNVGGDAVGSLVISGSTAVTINVDDLILGRNGTYGVPSANTNSTGTLDLALASSVDIDANNVIIGLGGSNRAYGEGSLLLSDSGTNTITATNVTVGDSSNTNNDAGTSTLELGQANTINVDTFTVGGEKSVGEVTIDAGGTLTLNGKGGVGAETDLFVGNNSASGTGTNNNGVFDLSGGTLNATLDDLVIGSYAGTGSGSGNGEFTMEAGTVTANAVTLASSVGTNAANTDGVLNQNGGDLTVDGSITSNGGSAVYNLSGGTLRFLTLDNAGGTFGFNFSGGTIANLSGQDLNNVDVDVNLTGAGPRVIDIETGQTGTFQAAAALTGTGGFEKTGGGTLILTGASSYSGDTQVSAGTLSVVNTTGSATGNSNEVIVADGTSLIGTGSVDSEVTVEDGGFVAPGLLAGDIEDLGTGDLNLEAGSTYTADLSGAASDTIVANGDVVIAGDLDIVYGAGAIVPGTVYTLIENTGGTTTGQFNGLAEGSIISLAIPNPTTGPTQIPAQLLRISYQGGSGNDVTLTASTETATTNIHLDGTTLTLEDIAGNNTKDNLSVRVEGGALVITDLSGNTLGTLINGAVQTEFNEISFTPGTGVGQVPFTDILINTGDEADRITIGDLGNGVLPGSITVNGGDDFDTIRYTGTSTLGTGNDASFTAEKVEFKDSDLTTTGDGLITVTGTGGIAEGGGNFIGVDLRNSSLSSGSGKITLTGEGGDTGNHNHGVRVFAGSSITTTNGGDIEIDGTGGGAVSGVGVFMNGNVMVSATLGGTLDIDGTGGGTIGGDGVLLSSGVSLSVEDGAMTIDGTGGASGGATQGVSTNKASLSSTGSGNIEITGISLGAGKSTGGVDMVSTDIDALTGGGTGSVIIDGTGSSSGTRHSFGVQLLGVDVKTAATATIDIDGVGNGTGSSNAGVILSGATSLNGGTITIDGTGSTTGTSNSDGVVFAKGTNIVASGGLTIVGISGTGSGSQGVSSQKSSLSGASISIQGTSTATGGKSNQGVSLISTDLTSSGALGISGTGGIGSKSNHGVYVSGGSLTASGLLTMGGVASGNTTGSSNQGVYLMKVNLSGLLGGANITGSGGGLLSGLGNSNHGIYMHKIIGSISGPTSFIGTAGFGDRSKAEEGNFFLTP